MPGYEKDKVSSIFCRHKSDSYYFFKVFGVGSHISSDQLLSGESAQFISASRKLPAKSPVSLTNLSSPSHTCKDSSPSSSPKCPRQSCIWFQKEKYRLHSIASELEGKIDSQTTFSVSMQTESTQNSSSRPSNQFSYLSSQSSWLQPEPPLIAQSEPSDKTNPSKPESQTASAITTLCALKSAISNDAALHPQASGDTPGGISHTPASTLALLRGDFAIDETSSSLSSDLASLLSTNNSGSPLQHSTDSMDEEGEPPPQSQCTLLSSQNMHMTSPFKVRMSLHNSKSPSVEPQTCCSTKPNLERVSPGVGTSPVSTLTCLHSENIPPTPVSCGTLRKPNFLARINLSTPTQSLPAVIQSDIVEQSGANESLDTLPPENPVFYSMTTYCSVAGGPNSPPYNAVAVSCGAILH